MLLFKDNEKLVSLQPNVWPTLLATVHDSSSMQFCISISVFIKQNEKLASKKRVKAFLIFIQSISNLIKGQSEVQLQEANNSKQNSF